MSNLDPVRRQVEPIFHKHVDVFVNQDTMDAAAPELYQAFLNLRHEFGITPGEFLVRGAHALRIAHSNKVKADNMTPGDFM